MKLTNERAELQLSNLETNLSHFWASHLHGSFGGRKVITTLT